MLWNSFGWNFRNVSEWYRAEVREVSLAGFGIPFAAKHAIVAHLIKRNTYTANSREQVNKSMLWIIRSRVWYVEKVRK